MTFTAHGQRIDAPQTSAAVRAGNRKGLLTVAICLALLIGSTLLLRILTPPASLVPLSIDNPEPSGGRAAAQILAERGVTIDEVSSTQAALDAAGSGTTLLVARAHNLREVQLDALRKVEADVVLVDLHVGSIETLTDAVKVTGGGARGEYPAECGNPHAQAAGELSTRGPGVSVNDGVTGCFPLTEDSYAFATWTDGSQSWTVVPHPSPLTNAGLDEAGNAALMMRLLGSNETLTWYLPHPNDDYSGEAPPPPQIIPTAVVAMAVLLGCAVVFWRGRALGPVVVEHLPVVVRATETTRGRGRLYRRDRAFAHAGAALRAGTIRRLAARTGIPRTAGRTDVVAGLARASGRSLMAIDSLLYGPPPTDDAALLAMTQALDTLESEVHQR